MNVRYGYVFVATCTFSLSPPLVPFICMFSSSMSSLLLFPSLLWLLHLSPFFLHVISASFFHVFSHPLSLSVFSGLLSFLVLYLFLPLPLQQTPLLSTSSSIFSFSLCSCVRDALLLLCCSLLPMAANSKNPRKDMGIASWLGYYYVRFTLGLATQLSY